MPGPDFVDGDVLEEGDIDALPKGIVGHAEVFIGQTGIGASADITSLSLSYAFVAGRKYRLQHFCESVSGSVLNNRWSINIYYGATIVQRRFIDITTASANIGGGVVTTIISPGTSATVTVKVAMIRESGAGTAEHNADTNIPAYLIIEDLGTQ